jgi:hypothetical protein
MSIRRLRVVRAGGLVGQVRGDVDKAVASRPGERAGRSSEE